MTLTRFRRECPGISATIDRMFEEEVAERIALDYEAVSDAGGNKEAQIFREEGVSFNPRVARILSIVIQDGGLTGARELRVAMYATVSSVERVSHALSDELAGEVRSVLCAQDASSDWIRVIRLSLVLDRVRHLHMTNVDDSEKLVVLDEVGAQALRDCGAGVPERLVSKVSRAIQLQRQRVIGDMVSK